MLQVVRVSIRSRLNTVACDLSLLLLRRGGLESALLLKISMQILSASTRGRSLVYFPINVIGHLSGKLNRMRVALHARLRGFEHSLAKDGV